MLSAELTLGFERELYQFSEPTSTSSQVTEMICISVKDGSVGTALIVTPMWVPNTATGMTPKHGNYEMAMVVKCTVFMMCAVGVDYRNPSNEYLLNPGETRNCVDITILNDNQFEFDEDLTGRLLRVTDINRNTAPADRLTIDVDETLITIEDNDG